MGDLWKLLIAIFILALMALVVSTPEKQDEPTVSQNPPGPENGGAK